MTRSAGFGRMVLAIATDCVEDGLTDLAMDASNGRLLEKRRNRKAAEPREPHHLAIEIGVEAEGKSDRSHIAWILGRPAGAGLSMWCFRCQAHPPVRQAVNLRLTKTDKI